MPWAQDVDAAVALFLAGAACGLDVRLRLVPVAGPVLSVSVSMIQVLVFASSCFFDE